jgi:Resolvase, N terminal domain
VRAPRRVLPCSPRWESAGAIFLLIHRWDLPASCAPKSAAEAKTLARIAASLSAAVTRPTCASRSGAVWETAGRPQASGSGSRLPAATRDTSRARALRDHCRRRVKDDPVSTGRRRLGQHPTSARTASGTPCWPPGTRRSSPTSSPPGQASSTCALGHLVIMRQSRAARSLRNLLDIADQFRERSIDLMVPRSAIDTATPAGRLAFRCG